jgi:hypothetical protein
MAMRAFASRNHAKAGADPKIAIQCSDAMDRRASGNPAEVVLPKIR